MSRALVLLALAVASFPRSRGDEPCTLNTDQAALQFSPLTRG